MHTLQMSHLVLNVYTCTQVMEVTVHCCQKGLQYQAATAQHMHTGTVHGPALVTANSTPACIRPSRRYRTRAPYLPVPAAAPVTTVTVTPVHKEAVNVHNGTSDCAACIAISGSHPTWTLLL
jgi:hypothetical protein